MRARLGAILAAATPRTGWVPERIPEPNVEPSEPTPMPIPDPAADADSLPASGSSGRHRGGSGPGARLRWDPGRPGAVALCLVAVLAALLSAGLTWWSRPQPASGDESDSGAATATYPMGSQTGTAGAGQAGSTAVDDSEPGAGSRSEQLVVSVIGQVHQPGLVTVNDGARVADVITAAGGALPDADLSTVNLARLVVDGEQIAVGVPGSSLPGDASPPPDGLLDLNTASQADLEELPGIGPVLAQRIVDFREENGGFTAVEELREVSGIGPTIYEDIVDLVTV